MTNKLYNRVLSCYQGEYSTKNYFYRAFHFGTIKRRRRGSAWDCWEVFKRDDSGHWHIVED